MNLKKDILKFIEQNEGTDLLGIYDKFKKSEQSPIAILDAVTRLEEENKITLSVIDGYKLK